MVLKIRTKVIRYNRSNKMIESNNKRSQQIRILFHFVLAILHICTALHYKAYLASLFDISIERPSVSVQGISLPNIVYKLHRDVGSVLIIHFM